MSLHPLSVRRRRHGTIVASGMGMSADDAQKPNGTKDTRRRLPSRGTVLLVEDSPVVRAYLLAALASDAWAVVSAVSGEEALRRAANHPDPIDILVADVVLPEMNGRELAEKLQEQRPQLKVLFMSGTPKEEIYSNGLLRPGTPYLEKPFAPALLLDTLRTLASR